MYGVWWKKYYEVRENCVTSNSTICTPHNMLKRRYSGLYSFKYTNKMEHYTIFFITVNAPHVLGGFSAHHQELKTVKTASGKCRACLLLPLAVSDAVCTVLSSWWWAKKPYVTCGALTVITNSYNATSCWYTWKNTLTMHGPTNVKLWAMSWERHVAGMWEVVKAHRILIQ